jgi:hypothetical protein
MLAFLESVEWEGAGAMFEGLNPSCLFLAVRLVLVLRLVSIVCPMG